MLITAQCTSKNKEADIIYCQFPATSLDVLDKLDNEVKVLKFTKIDVYNALVSYTQFHGI